MSMMDNILGMGRYGSVNESWEPELQNDDFDSVEPLARGVDSMEFMMESIFNNELNMRNLDTAIMCEEYAYLRENGAEMVYEAGTITNIIEKAKKAILKLWEDIQKFLKDQIEKFTSKAESNFLKKYESKAAGRKVKVKSDPNLFKFGVENTVKNATDMMTKLEEAAKKVADDARGIEIKPDDNSEVSTGNPTYTELDEWLKTFNATMANIYGAANVKAGYTPSEVINSVIAARKDAMEVTAQSADDAITEYRALSGEKGRKELRKIYEKSRSNINQYLKTLKRMETAAKKFKVIPTDASGEIHKAVRTVNKLGSYTAKVNRGTIKMLNMIKSQCKNIIMVAAAQDVKNLKESANNSYIESVEVL